MLQVLLSRTDRDGLFAILSRPFPDLASLARFFAEGGGDRWDQAEVLGQPRPYPAETLIQMAVGLN